MVCEPNSALAFAIRGPSHVCHRVACAIVDRCPGAVPPPRSWALIALQIGILLTGNYAFFNLLTIALCILLFEDSVWPEKWRKRIRLGATFSARRRPAWILPVAVPIACAIALLTALPLLSALGLPLRALAWLGSAYEAVAPLRSFNGYGLFAVMTTKPP